MSDTMDPMATDVDRQELAQQLLAQASAQGIDLVSPNGLLNRLTKNVLETALEAEKDRHLGYEKHDVAGRGSGAGPRCRKTGGNDDCRAVFDFSVTPVDQGPMDVFSATLYS